MQRIQKNTRNVVVYNLIAAVDSSKNLRYSAGFRGVTSISYALRKINEPSYQINQLTISIIQLKIFF